jgi:hypothetical protein
MEPGAIRSSTEQRLTSEQPLFSRLNASVPKLVAERRRTPQSCRSIASDSAPERPKVDLYRSISSAGQSLLLLSLMLALREDASVAAVRTMIDASLFTRSLAQLAAHRTDARLNARRARACRVETCSGHLNASQTVFAAASAAAAASSSSATVGDRSATVDVADVGVCRRESTSDLSNIRADGLHFVTARASTLQTAAASRRQNVDHAYNDIIIDLRPANEESS